MATNNETHPWVGARIYLDFGDGLNGGEVSGEVAKVEGTNVSIQTAAALVVEDYTEAIYVEVTGFGVIDI